MAHSSNPSLRASRGLLGLFEEAWRRQRQRRLRLALLTMLLMAATAAIIIVRVDRPSPRPSHGASVATLGRLSSGVLPASGHYASLTQAGGQLIAAGGPGGYPLNVSGASTTLVHGRAVGRCAAATVTPGSVRLEPARHANCGDPTLYGLRVMPIIALLRPGHQPAIDQVRIAVADPAARDGYRLGPVVMRYPECSDCNAQWVTGDGSVWINGPFAGGRPGSGGEILRVSAADGRVLQRYAIPVFVRALLAVDRDGLWIAPSIETGLPAGHLTPRAWRDDSSLYLLSPGARQARRVLDLGNGTPWLAADRDRVWLELTSHGGDRMITFTGDSAQHRREGPHQHNATGTADELGEGTTPYAATFSGAVEGVIAPNSSHQAVISYNGRTLTEQVLATTPLPDAYDETPDAVAIDGSLYFLDPGVTFAKEPVTGQLYRLHTG